MYSNKKELLFNVITFQATSVGQRNVKKQIIKDDPSQLYVVGSDVFKLLFCWNQTHWIFLFLNGTDFVTQRNQLCLWTLFVSSQVLATGLSALYSSLPRKIEVRGDDWHALRREDWIGVSSLVLFMNSLEFCNAVVQVAHPLVRSQLLDYLHNGFLVPVMGPALHKVGRICGRDVIKFGLCNHRLRAFDRADLFPVVRRVIVWVQKSRTQYFVFVCHIQQNCHVAL